MPAPVVCGVGNVRWRDAAFPAAGIAYHPFRAVREFHRGADGRGGVRMAGRVI